MLIDNNFILQFGLPISDEIATEKIERAIFTAENIIIKPRLGWKLYADITENPTQYETVLNGGLLLEGDKHLYVAGLKAAEAHLSFSILLGENLNSTTFGTVLKNDEYSSHADEDRLRRAIMTHNEIGLEYLKEITDYYKIHNTDKHLPNVGEELI